MKKIRLGVNIDHVATLRNARGGPHPDPVKAARLAEEAGADGITVHLREDRRHIKDEDILNLRRKSSLPLNLEMAATEEMLAIAVKIQPNACCLVPEKREELTTEGGLNVLAKKDYFKDYIKKLQDNGIRVSLFIEPDADQIHAAGETGADIIELHTGLYCNTYLKGESEKTNIEFNRISKAAQLAYSLGIECHAGHGLGYDTAAAVAAIPEITELNIGHFLIGEALFIGLSAAVARMKRAINTGIITDHE